MNISKKQRLSKIGQFPAWKKLFEGKHEEVLRPFTELKDDERYISSKLFQRFSKTYADFTMKDAPTFNYVGEKVNKRFFAALERNTNLEENGKTLVHELSWRGCAIRKGRLVVKHDGSVEPVIEPVDPDLFYYDTHPDDNTRIVDCELCYFFTRNGVKYLRKEIHIPYKIVQELYVLNKDGELDGQLDIETFYKNEYGIDIQAEVETGIPDILVEYIPNFKASETDFEGISDYEGLIALVAAYDTILSRSTNTILNNFRPQRMAPAEFAKRDNRGRAYFPDDDIIWMTGSWGKTPNGILVPQQIQVDIDTNALQVLTEIIERNIIMASEIDASALGMVKDGLNAQAAKALRYKMINVINNSDRKRTAIDMAFRRLAENLMYVALYTNPNTWKGLEPEHPSMEWSNGISEWDETVDTVVKLSGLLSKKEQIRLIWPAWSEEKIEQVLKELSDEQASSLDAGIFKSLETLTPASDPSSTAIEGEVDE